MKKLSLEELKKEEKKYFDTYKQKRSPEDKITYLRKMADVIEQIKNYK